MAFIMVKSTAPATQYAEVVRVSLETHMEYPSFMEKIMDAGANYTSYAIYKCEDSNLAEGLGFIAVRFHKIASQIAGYEFKAEILLDIAEFTKLVL
jgi:hypothetical protein